MEVTHFLDSVEGEPKELVRIMYPFSMGSGAPEYFLEISRDVTQYRDLITKLRASEKRFKAILDTATDAILSIDTRHRIVLFNDAAQRIFGYERDEVIGKDLNMLIPAQYGDHYRFVKKFMETKTPKIVGHNLSLTGLRKGGEEFPIELGFSYQMGKKNKRSHNFICMSEFKFHGFLLVTLHVNQYHHVHMNVKTKNGKGFQILDGF